MTRDFDLIRSILFQAEKAPSGASLTSLVFDEDIPDAIIAEHLEIMIEANLIEGAVFGSNPLSFTIRRLAWNGHDFLDHARNDTIWKKVMAEAKAKGISTTLVILQGMLSKAAEKYAGLKTSS